MNKKNKLSIGLLEVAFAIMLPGCAGLHIHQPEDLQAAEAAQSHFKSTELDKTIVEERERLNSVLESELNIVKKHTLALRDQYLIFLIKNGYSAITWKKNLKNNIDKRIDNLGVSSDTQAYSDKLVTQIHNKKTIDSDESKILFGWPAGGPNLKCSIKNGLGIATKKQLEKLVEQQKFEYDRQKVACDKYIKSVKNFKKETNKYTAQIQSITEAIGATEVLMKIAKKDFKTASDEYKEELNAKFELTDLTEGLKEKIDNLGEAINSIDKLEEKITQLPEVKALNGVVANVNDIINKLKAKAKLASIEGKRQKLLGILDVIIKADPSLDEETEESKKLAKELKIASLLATGAKALGKANSSTSISALQLEAENLRLDMLVQEKEEAILQSTLEILKNSEAALSEEIKYLVQTERLREKLVKSRPVENKPKIPAKNIIADKELLKLIGHKPKGSNSQDLALKLLMSYSNAWTFGRLPQELNDYRLIALQYDAALNSSETAFTRWQNLLSIPLSQMIALHKTGLKPEDIATIVEALGLSAIAVGVN